MSTIGFSDTHGGYTYREGERDLWRDIQDRNSVGDQCVERAVTHMQKNHANCKSVVVGGDFCDLHREGERFTIELAMKRMEPLRDWVSSGEQTVHLVRGNADTAAEMDDEKYCQLAARVFSVGRERLKLHGLMYAHELGKQHVLFTHGHVFEAVGPGHIKSMVECALRGEPLPPEAQKTVDAALAEAASEHNRMGDTYDKGMRFLQLFGAISTPVGLSVDKLFRMMGRRTTRKWARTLFALPELQSQLHSLVVGHTHAPSQENVRGKTVVNTGSLAGAPFGFNPNTPPTYCVVDESGPRLVSVENT